MSLKKFTSIMPSELKSKGVVSLADKPNTASSYGVGGLSPTNLKLWFDQLSTLLAEKINAIYAALSGESAAEYMRLMLDGLDENNETQEYSLQDLCDAFVNGLFASYLRVYDSVSATQLKPLQTVLDERKREYAMYVNGSGSGVRAGRKSEIYLAAKNLYDNLKREIIDRKMHGRLTEFCRYYIEEELRNTRNSLLTEVGIDFAKYQECYVGKDKAALEKIPSLSKSQVEAILAANKVKPIKLTPEMILKRGRGSARRNPLGIEPEKRRRAGYAMKFFLTFGLAILMTVITLNPKANLTWGTFAECILKLFPVMLNGFTGYKNGYENIIVHTVNYINDQIDLMRQLIHYVEENPTPKLLVSASEIVEKKEQTEIPAAENMPPADGLETVSAEAI